MSDAGSFNAETNLSLNIDFSNTGLKDIKDTLKEIAKGKDLQRYWKDVESATNDAASAIKKYSKNVGSKNLAGDFLKQINAIRALTKKENLSEIFPNMDVDFQDLITTAKAVAPEVSSAFSKDVFEQAFRSFQLLKDESIELFDVFNQLADYSRVVSKNFELRNKNKSLESLFDDSDIEKLKKNEEEIRKLRAEAEETFEAFLKLNKIERTDYWGNENFSEFFDDIKDGTLTATEAIAKFKTEYGHLLEENFKSSGNNFGLDQLQEFSNKLDYIFYQVEETSNKINSIIENGIIAKSVQNLSEDTSLSDPQRSLFGDLLKDEESLKSITDLVKRLIDESQKTKNTDVFNEGQFEEIKKLFQNIEESLSAIKGVLVDVGDGEELSPLLKKLEEIREASANIKVGFNFDLGDGVNERLNQRVSQATTRQLEAYRNLFSAMKSTGKTNKEMLQFFEPDDATVSELIGMYKSIIKRAIEQFKIGNSNIYKDYLGSTYDKLWKDVNNANAQLSRAKKKQSDNGILSELFGSQDLNGIIEQLKEIITQLGEISTSARNLADSFNKGLNITTSIAEVETLTQRVQALEEELAKVKPVEVVEPQTPQVENNNSKEDDDYDEFAALFADDYGEKISLDPEKTIQALESNFGTLEKSIKQELTELLNTVTQETTSSLERSILGILTESDNFISSTYNGYDEDPQQSQLRDYIRGRKIKYSPQYRSEFGDDWNKYNATLGFTTKNGTDIMQILSDCNEQLGTTFDLTESNQNAIRQLYEALSKKPDISIDNLPNDVKDVVSQIIDECKVGEEAVENILNPISETNISSGSTETIVEENSALQQQETQIGEVNEGLEQEKSLLDQLIERIEKIRMLGVVGGGKSEEEILKNYGQESTDHKALRMQLDGLKTLTPSGKVNPDIRDMVFNPEISAEEVAKKLLDAAQCYQDCKNALDKLFADNNIVGGKVYNDAYRFLDLFSDDALQMASVVGETREKLTVMRKEQSNKSDSPNLSSAIDQQNEYQEELKETENQAEKTTQAVSEVGFSSQMKDAFQGETGSGNVTEIKQNLEEVVPVENQVAENFQEIRQETDKAAESAKKYGNILSQTGLVGAQYNDDGEQIPSRYSYVRQTGEKQIQTITVKYEKDNESGEIVENEIIGDYITGFQALEKEIDKADKKVADLKKNLELNKLKLGSNYDSSSQEQLIEEAEEYANLLYKALETYDKYPDYEYSIAQYVEERVKKQANYNTQLQNALKIEQARVKNASDKNDISEEQKRQKNIAQTNRLLTKQQITINGIVKSYNKMANPDLDKAVENPDDFKQLAKKKQKIQGLINKLSGQERNSSNEKEFLQIEKLIAEYKQLAKDKLKANNPSKQQLGGENLKVSLQNQVAQYNKLIEESEKYGSVTREITEELKRQRDLIAEQDEKGVYVARSTRADGKAFTADDYYNTRDSYKINKSILGSYKTDSKDLEIQLATYNELIDTIERYKTVANKIERKGSTEALDEELATLQVRIEELQNSPILSEKQVQASYDMLKKIEDKLINIQETTAHSIIKDANSSVSSYSGKIDGYNKAIARLQSGGWSSDAFVTNIKAAQTALVNYENSITELKQKAAQGIVTREDIDNVKNFEVALNNAIKTIKGMSAAEKGYDLLSGQKELDKIHKILKEYTAMSAEAKAQIRAYYKEIASGNPSATLDVIHGKIMEIVNAEIEAGRGGKSLLSVIKDKAWYGLASQIGMYFGLNDFIRYIREGIDVVTELDTALTEMRKVSDETTTSLKAYQETTFDVADAVGTTAVQIQNSTADWQRLGYSLSEAASLAENSNIYKNVGDMEIEEATEHMISSVQAWKSEFNDDAVKTSEAVMNRYNKIGNEFAISSADIGEAMETSAAALKAGGNDLNESLGLLTAGNLIQQDASTTSSALKILSLRIRGASAELEEMGESTDGLADSTSKMREEILALTGVDIMENEDTFKSTAEIIQEIGKNWDKMTDVSQAAALEKLAGKNRASTVAGLIENYETIGEVIEAAENAENSALEENEKYLDSIDGRRFCHVA
jgi:hypothetical protein